MSSDKLAKRSPVAVVTGASGGVGRIVAAGLGKDGYRVGMLSRRKGPLNARSRQDPSRSNDQAGATALPFEVDLTDDVGVADCIEVVISTWGRIDCLVNTVGIWVEGGLECEPAAMEALVRNNLVGPAIAMRHVIPHMKTQRCGQVVNICSIAAIEPYPGGSWYAASKAALLALSKATQYECASYRIRVTAVCPGWINTSMAAKSALRPEEMLQPNDILQVVRFLLGLSANAVVFQLVLDCINDLSS